MVNIKLRHLSHQSLSCLPQGAHSDWIFDMTWIDEQFVVSGSRDGSMALWQVSDEMLEDVVSRPLMKKQCKMADCVRSLCYNHHRQEIAVISLNGYIHCWNATRFKQVCWREVHSGTPWKFCMNDWFRWCRRSSRTTWRMFVCRWTRRQTCMLWAPRAAQTSLMREPCM